MPDPLTPRAVQARRSLRARARRAATIRRRVVGTSVAVFGIAWGLVYGGGQFGHARTATAAAAGTTASSNIVGGDDGYSSSSSSSSSSDAATTQSSSAALAPVTTQQS